MKSLSLFVNESLSNKQKELIGEVFSCMFKNTKLNKFVISYRNGK